MGFQKNEIFWVMKSLWIFFGVITKLGKFQGSFLMNFMVFLKLNVHNWDIVLGCKISNNVLGCLIFLIIFWGKK